DMAEAWDARMRLMEDPKALQQEMDSLAELWTALEKSGFLRTVCFCSGACERHQLRDGEFPSRGLTRPSPRCRAISRTWIGKRIYRQEFKPRKKPRVFPSRQREGSAFYSEFAWPSPSFVILTYLLYYLFNNYRHQPLPTA